MNCSLNQTFPLHLEIFFPTKPDSKIQNAKILCKTFIMPKNHIEQKTGQKKIIWKKDSQSEKLYIRLGSLSKERPINLSKTTSIRFLKGFRKMPKFFKNESEFVKNSPKFKKLNKSFNFPNSLTTPARCRIQKQEIHVSNILPIPSKEIIIKQAKSMNKEIFELTNWTSKRNQSCQRNQRKYRRSCILIENSYKTENKKDKFNHSFYYKERIYDKDLEKLLINNENY